MNRKTTRKFLVTGGCGFIGSHLVDKLISQGHSVIIIDDLSTGYLTNIKPHIKKVVLYQEKVENFNFYKLEKVDCVFHLAAQASVPLSIQNFFLSSSSNMLSTFKVIEYCTKKTIPLVYASSSAVYGNLSFGDETGEIQLLSPYAADKYSMEMYLAAGFELNKLPSFGLRFFNVYGPRQDASSPYSGVISLFISQLLHGKPIFVNGGFQTRDFIFVKDVVNCLYKAYHYLIENIDAKVANVLTGKSISINTLYESISNLMNIKQKCIYRELPAGDPINSSGSTALLESLLSIQPSTFINIETGLLETIAFERTKL